MPGFKLPRLFNQNSLKNPTNALRVNTTSSHRDNIDKITRLVRTLQESKLENKKMREAFTRSLQTQTRLQDNITRLKNPTPEPISHNDSVFKKFQTKLDFKLAAFAQKISNTLKACSGPRWNNFGTNLRSRTSIDFFYNTCYRVGLTVGCLSLRLSVLNRNPAFLFPDLFAF